MSMESTVSFRILFEFFTCIASFHILYEATYFARSRIHFLLSPRNTGSHRKLQDTRRSPSIRPKPLGIGLSTSFLLNRFITKRKLPDWVTSVKMLQASLRWHYPHQVYGSKVIPSSQPVSQAPHLIVEQNRRHPFGMPPVKNPCIRLPTSALPASGYRVEGCAFLSACITSSPVLL